MVSKELNMNKEKCDEEIYAHGTPIAMIAGSSLDIQEIVEEASSLSGIQMDWHYVAGRGVIKTLGDAKLAYHWLSLCMPQIVKL